MSTRIAKELMKDRIIKLRYLGTFYLLKINYKKNNICGFKKRKIINPDRAKFKMKPKFSKEVLKKVTHFDVSNRTAKILELNEIDTKI